MDMRRYHRVSELTKEQHEELTHWAQSRTLAVGEVLNRWIVPMERRVDYLSFLTGGKMTAPFEAFLVFSTNLNPADLGTRPSCAARCCCAVRRATSSCASSKPSARIRSCHTPATLDGFIDKHYGNSGKVFRRCHPRDVLTHALNLTHFEKLPYELTVEVLDHAFASCCVQDEESGNPEEAVIVRPASKPCAEYWAERAKDATAFGRLGYFASFRDRFSGIYSDAEALRDYEAGELSRTLTAMHANAFRDWLGMNLEQQGRDLARYLSTAEGRAAFLSFDRRELIAILAPPEAKAEQRQLFNNDLTTVLAGLSQRQHPEAATPAPMERIA